MAKKSRGYYMSHKDKALLGYDAETDMCNVKRTHQNCIELTGVARPGKTAKDRARSAH